MGEFFPTSLDGWLGLFMTAVSVIGTAFALIYKALVKPLADDLAGHKRDHGERMGRTELAVSANASKIESLDRQQDRLHIQIAGISEQFGRMETRLQGLDVTLYRFHEERLSEDRRAGERLIAIETKMEHMQDTLDKFTVRRE
jgi:SMC interacting uncharacterized protein involved in chromosome segregation